MAYSSTNTITAADYNSFVATVNGVIGVGSGTKGYNQSTLTTVSATDQITAAHWTALLAAVSKAATHQGTSVTIPGASNTGYPATDDTIHAFDGSQTIGGASYSYNLTGAITDIDSNYQNVDTGEQTTVAGQHTSTRTSAWGGEVGTAAINTDVTATFASQNAVRGFFNTGGEIHITMDQPTATTTQSTSWNTVFDTSIGTIKMGYTGTTRTGNAGTPSTTVGFHDLTSSYATIFEGTNIGSGAYSANDVLVQAKSDGAGVITFQITLDDQHAPTAPSAVDTVESGTNVVFAIRKSSQYSPANPNWATAEAWQ
jgi:hypothetical protein